MNQYNDTNIMPNPVLRDRAKGVLTGKYSKAILAFFIVWLITLGASLITSLLFTFLWAVIMIIRSLIVGGMSIDVLFDLLKPSSLDEFQALYNLLDHILGVGISMLTGVLSVGLSLFCLNLACGRQAEVSDIFYGFKQQFGKSFRLSVVYTLAEEICLLPFSIFYYLYNRNASRPLQGIALCLTLAGLAVATYILLHISQCFFLMLDFPSYSAGELLRLSSRVMQGHKTRLFLLYLSFLPLFALSLFTFGIANLWIIPYRGVTKAFFFLNLMQARDSSTTSDNH